MSSQDFTSSGTITEGFEGSTAGWSVLSTFAPTTDQAHSGAKSFGTQAGDADTASRTLTFGASASVTFWLKVTGAVSTDIAYLFIDDVTTAYTGTGGNVGWVQVGPIAIDPGEHKISWDISNNAEGFPTATARMFFDDVTFTNVGNGTLAIAGKTNVSGIIDVGSANGNVAIPLSISNVDLATTFTADGLIHIIVGSAGGYCAVFNLGGAGVSLDVNTGNVTDDFGWSIDPTASVSVTPKVTLTWDDAPSGKAIAFVLLATRVGN